MSKFTFTLLASLFVSFCYGQHFELYKGDTVNRIDLDGQKQGPWILYGTDFNVKLKCFYKNDQQINTLNYFDQNNLVLKLHPMEKGMSHFTYYTPEDSIRGFLNYQKNHYLLVNNSPVDKSLDAKLRAILEILPMYPGGQDSLSAYLKENIKFPKEAEEKAKEGKVKVYFEIDKNGFVTDMKIKKSAGKLFDEEALRVVKEMKRWQPGNQNGKAVKVAMILPVNFRLNKKK